MTSRRVENGVLSGGRAIGGRLLLDSAGEGYLRRWMDADHSTRQRYLLEYCLLRAGCSRAKHSVKLNRDEGTRAGESEERQDVGGGARVSVPRYVISNFRAARLIDTSRTSS